MDLSSLAAAADELGLGVDEEGGVGIPMANSPCFLCGSSIVKFVTCPSGTRDMQFAVATALPSPSICNWLFFDEMLQTINIRLIKLHFSTAWGRGN